jgi:hypothetical protein
VYLFTFSYLKSLGKAQRVRAGKASQFYDHGYNCFPLDHTNGFLRLSPSVEGLKEQFLGLKMPLMQPFLSPSLSRRSQLVVVFNL